MSDARGVGTTSIETFCGKIVDLLNPQVRDIEINDIGHSLALINRYNGHTIYPMSVAQHSVNVSLVLPVDNLNLRKWGLLHDAHEAYVQDITRPMRRTFKSVGILNSYEAIVDRFDKVIAAKFVLEPLTVEERTKLDYADLAVCRTEAEATIRSHGAEWQWGEVQAAACSTRALEWFEARYQFIETFRRLFLNELHNLSVGT